MATQILGKVGILLRGEYNSSTTYAKLDVVTYHGSSYACKANNTVGILPTNTDYWQLLSQGGTIIERMEIVNGDLLVTYNE